MFLFFNDILISGWNSWDNSGYSDVLFWVIKSWNLFFVEESLLNSWVIFILVILGVLFGLLVGGIIKERLNISF